jgi:diguanylate cyclase (GGDEF)-like protein/PAS domain S-box-containing protein
MNAVHFLKAVVTADAATERRGRVSVFRRAQDWLRHRGATDQAAILNALPAHAAVLNAQGRIMSVNKAWQQFETAAPNYGPGPKVGRNYVDICDSASESGLREAQQIAMGIRSVLTGGLTTFSMEYSCHSNSQQQWFALTVTPLGDGPTRGAMVMYRDITAERALENALHESEFRVRQMTESMRDSRLRPDKISLTATDAVVTLDEDMRVVLSNPAAETMFGYTNTALRGQPLHILFSEPIRAPRSLAIANFREPGTDGPQANSSRAVTAVRKSGEQFQSEASISTFNVNGRRYFTATLRDLSERHSPQPDPPELQQPAAAPGSDVRIKRLSRVYAVLSEINALIVRVKDRQEFFSEACRIAVDAGTFSMASIGVIDPQTQMGKAVAWYGGKQEYVSGIPLTSIEGGFDSQRAEWRALREVRPVICNDIATDPSVLFIRDELLERGYKSFGCFPLIVAGRPAAVLTLYAAEPKAFDAGEARLLLELAANISFALDHLEKQERLNYLACYDELTGLANRGLFVARIAQFVRGASAGGDRLVLGVIDLERFRNINQSLGRTSGDALLQQVADWLVRTLGEIAFLARIGADQFAVVFPTALPETELGQLAEQVIEAFLRHPFRLNEAVFHVGAKIGIALYPDDGGDADTLLRNAEAALRVAKIAGDRYLFYTPRMTETVVARLNLENLLRQALDKGQFELYYQPKMNLLTGQLTGAEALIRWNDPLTGLVLPGKFIPVLEETGLIHEVGRWALHRAIEDHARWRASGLHAIRIAVNVSAMQLRSPGFIAQVKQAVAVDPAAASGLELEITESVIMEDVLQSGLSLHALRALGVSIAIDDFGTGFSSLSYLSKLPLDTLKIDRSFVHDMTAGPQGRVLISTIITLAHSLKLKVIAEGVETEEQSGILRTLGCDDSQGHLFGSPAPIELFESTYLAPVAIA